MDRLLTTLHSHLRMFACLVMALLAAGGVICPVGLSLAGYPPESILLDQLKDLYEPVVFDHAMHLDLYDCSRCHHHTAGTVTGDKSCGRCHQTAAHSNGFACSSCHVKVIGSKGKAEERGRYHIDVPSLQGAMHLLCRNCHLEEGGPADCLDCHDYSDAGRKRFLVKD